MRVILSGGGTGGHIYPALAIANKIREKFPEAEILFIGTEGSLESDLVPKAGYKIKFIPISYLKRSLAFHNLKTAGKLVAALFEARRIIRSFRPELVIGTGGFVCGPVLYVAAKMGFKTLIHEQNVFPGLTNRILASSVDRIAISFTEAEGYFKPKDKEKIVLTGNPVRDEFLKVSSKDASMKYRPDNRALVLIVGGSGGSKRLNQAAIDLLRLHSANSYRILLVTGKSHYLPVLEALKDNSDALNANSVLPYINDMPYALKACDLIICSSGAITIAEVAAVGKPSILIPKAHTAENHQEYNAKAIEAAGAAIMIRERELSGEALYEAIEKIISDKNTYSKMQEASARLAKTNALDLIFNEAIKLVDQ